MAAKYIEIADILKQRVARGDYTVNPIPGQPSLAKELGVSYLTARKAVERLIQQGILSREYNGRVKIVEQPRFSGNTPLNIAFLAPPTVVTWDWVPILQQIVELRGGSVRLIPYLDYDGTFIIPQDKIPRLALDLMIENRHRVVTLFQDLTEHGIPYIDQTPEKGVFRLIEHLVSLGHTTIDCLNAEPHNLQVEKNILNWQDALKHFGAKGTLRDVSADSHYDSALHAYRKSKQLFALDEWSATAVFSTAVRCVQGFYRATFEQGLQVGKDISVCAIGSYEYAQIMTPSLTCEKNPDRAPFLARGLDWILSGGKNWLGPLHICPQDAEVFKGESTGPAPE
jgi:hypothetical protein